jgi:hypothetical protein
MARIAKDEVVTISAAVMSDEWMKVKLEQVDESLALDCSAAFDKLTSD